MRKVDFNQQWTYHKEGFTENKTIIDLPHDAMIHETRDPESAGGSAVGFFPGGVYLYEKKFQVPDEWKEKQIEFEFEGVYRHSKILINDHEAGGRPYGYSRFFVNAGPFLQVGQENSIRVVVDNSQLPNSRWYSGSGIYRPVYLHILNKTHIAQDGVKISTLSYSPPKILVETSANGGEIHVDILDGDKLLATATGERVEISLPDAKCWSAESPTLYQCRVQLMENNIIVDEVNQSFGIRMVEWSTKGLFINGQETLLRGGCIHHDNGILGACAYDKAEERRVRILKEAGFNAIRSSHNPTSVALLNACDKYGMYVIDETFDMWYLHKNKFDYASDFDDWYLQDIKSMVDTDFNHPSVIMYSIANEVSEPYQERGMDLTQEMVKLIHDLDSNRAVTGGMNLMLIHLASKGMGIYKEEGGIANDIKPPKKKKKQKASGSLFFNMLASMVGPQMNRMANSNSADKVTTPCLDALDIAGYNYASGRYKLEGKKHPDRVIYGSETYPQDIAKNWKMVKELPYLVGDFMWTAWDYLGEAGLGAWSYDGSGFNKPYPWLISECGVIDILGNIGAQAKYAAIVWGLETGPYIGVRPVNHPGIRVSKGIWRGTNAISSWAWKNCAGNNAEIEVYARADVVELFINEKSLGKKKTKDFKAIYKTKYVPGTIKAVAYDVHGKTLYESELVSAMGKTGIALKCEEETVKAGELVYINIILAGENGVVESNDDRALTINVEGGRLLGFGSANPCPEDCFIGNRYTTYYGRALAVVQAGEGNALRVTVNGNDLEPISQTIQVIS